MGRVSKRKAADRQTTGVNADKRYKAGIYARLSSDQDQKKNGSIEVQIAMAEKFVAEYNQKNTGEYISVIRCYTDMGKTGSNFEREGFRCLMQDIRFGGINCVIVKDLSRFGRNYLEAGNYIEKIFSFFGVRFIAVADGFDTGRAGNENKQLAFEIKNLVNDMYAKDFSQKAKLQLRQRREEGSYVGGPPPYGYKVEWKEKRRVLRPDENTVAIVKFIYQKFVETESYMAVVRLLNQKKLNPPAIYKKTKEVYYSSAEMDYKGWDKSTVERILKSDVYVGTLVQGKTSITARNEKERIHKLESEWVITKSAHEPLIDIALYQRAEKICERIVQKTALRKQSTKTCPLEKNIFVHVLYCGVCKRKMTRSSYVKEYANGRRERVDGYFCLNAGQTKVALCSDSNRISKAELIEHILPVIHMVFAVFLEKPEKYVRGGRKYKWNAAGKVEASFRETERQLRYLSEEEIRTYMEYHSGNMSQQEYQACKTRQEEKQFELRKREAEQKEKLQALEGLSEQYIAEIEALIKEKSGKHLTKEMIETFLTKIYVYPGKRIEIIFSFTRKEARDGVSGNVSPIIYRG